MQLVVEGIKYRYPRGDRDILTGVDFSVPAATSAAIVGPSGSGKTTLLSLLGGLLPLQEGSIYAVGADQIHHSLTGLSTWVLQTVSLLPDRTALDNAMVGAFSAGLDRKEAETLAVKALQQVGLSGREHDFGRILSGGEAQRVAIARAIASTRPIIFADEPTGQLDAKTSETVLDAMFGVHGERTVVVVTHDMEVAARCDLVLELRNGKIVERVGR